MADGTAGASKVLGSFTFKRRELKHLDEGSANEAVQVVSGVRGTMPYTVKVGISADRREKIHDAVEATFTKAEQVFSLWLPDSEISRINDMPQGEAVELSDEMSEVLQAVNSLHGVTRAHYDPALEPLISYYKAAMQDLLGKGMLPRDRDPQAADIAQYAHWGAFILSPDGRRLTKTHEKAGLDLGGIAKGWAIDRVVHVLKREGYTDAYVEWGGDVRVMGCHPCGRPWSILIQEPPSIERLRAQSPTPHGEGRISDGDSKAVSRDAADAQYLTSLDLRDDDAIATSGDYMQVYNRAEKLVHHIYTPKTGLLGEVGSTHLAQVSVVVTGSCMYADALATATMAMSDVRDARKFLDSLAMSYHPVDDFLLYAREGPRVVRRVVRGSESEGARETRLRNHEAGARIVVIGGGLAGFSAAVEAARVGACVTLLEKEPQVGGNSAKATSGINGWGTRQQAQQGVHDEERHFERDTFRSGIGGLSDTSMVRRLSTQSAEAVRWLSEEMGVPLGELSQLGGHSRKRTHRSPPTEEGDARPVGWMIMQAVKAYVNEKLAHQVKIVTGARVTELLYETTHEDNSPPRKTVTGCKYLDTNSGREEVILSDAVVLTTGGFGCDFTSTDSLLRQHRPDLVEGEHGGVPSTNGAFATGDGVKLGMAIGALTVDMDQVQLHPTGFLSVKDPESSTKILGPEALRGSGGILVNQRGQRFVNELDLRSKVASAILEHCDPYPLPGDKEGNRYAWCILNKESQREFGLPALRFYKDTMGLFQAAADFPTLARDVIGCDVDALKQTIDAYAEACAMGICVQTKKSALPTTFTWEDTDLVAARITPAIHYTMGGLRTSSATEVMEVAVVDKGLYRKLRPIRRLFAAGEVTGGLHGGNRLGGNSLLECVVFGRTAGERAATIKQKSNTCLREDQWVPVTVREMLNTDVKYGMNTKVFRFNLHGALQTAGLEVGQYLGIRGEQDGTTITSFYSPISRPDEEGYIEILCRTDVQGGQMINLLTELRPGCDVCVKAMGGLRLRFEGHHVLAGDGRKVKQIGLLAGGTGIAPMIQIIRAYLHNLVGAGRQPGEAPVDPLRLVYAAERDFDLAFTGLLEQIRDKYPEYFDYYYVLNQPPLGWTGGVGFVDQDCIRKYLVFPPRDDQLIVICGPPMFERVMTKLLSGMGYPRQTFFAYSEAVR